MERRNAEQGGFTMQHGISEAALEQVAAWLDEADTVVVGGAAGMSAAGGSDPYGIDQSFLRSFGDFHRTFGVKSWFDAFYYPYPKNEQRWAMIARLMQFIDEAPVPEGYRDLARVLGGRDFFVVTTNQDQLFRRQFGDDRVAWIQGDWEWLQCGGPCCDELYPAESFWRTASARIHDCEIPTDLIPHCPHCGRELEPWVRGYHFLEGSLYREQYRKYNGFLEAHAHDRVLFLELGVGGMTPMFIKEPFWNYTYQWPGGARYVAVTKDHALVPAAIADRGLGLDADIAEFLSRLKSLCAADGTPNRAPFSTTQASRDGSAAPA